MPRRILLFLFVLLAGCRYTFLPLVPEAAPPPPAVLVEAELAEAEEAVQATLWVRRVPEPGYLVLRWFRGRRLLWEEARFVEGGEVLTLRLPKGGAGPYRLEARWRGRRVLLRLLGAPSPPKGAPPKRKGS